MGIKKGHKDGNLDAFPVQKIFFENFFYDNNSTIRRGIYLSEQHAVVYPFRFLKKIEHHSIIKNRKRKYQIGNDRVP
jgi:hypothetical protein